MRRWIRNGRLRAERTHGRRLIDPGALNEVRNEMYPMLPLPPGWQKLEERDYIAQPKSSGYRALHLIVRRMGFPIEVQLRTIGQDVWANRVEETGRQAGLDLKFGAGHERLNNIFLEMAELIARFDRAELSPHDLRKGLKRVPSLPIGEAREDDPNEPG